MAEYKETAKAIIKNAIKSAIFIDENALEPYVKDEKSSEGERSMALYCNLRDVGISLDVWKYNKDNYNLRQEYIFKNRDLILLDWKLEGESKGGEKALEILSDMVNKHKQIHFCIVYTAEDPQGVLLDLLSYFSPVTNEKSKCIKEDLAEYEEEINAIKSELEELSIGRYDKNKQKNLKSKIHLKYSDLINAIYAYFKDKNPSISKTDALVWAGIAFNNHIKSNTLQNSPISIDELSKTVYVNNTFISVLNKEAIRPDALFTTFGDAIANCKYGIMPLIGIEYQNIQREAGGIIEGVLAQISQETLGYHKKVSSEDFETFLKTVLMEQDALHSRQKSMLITEAISECDYDEKFKNEYVNLNVFYNSTILEGERFVSFGDVFKCDENYYMCITALCDCLRPQKRDYKFYFVKGSSISTDGALKLGDEGFVSFLPDKNCVRWNINGSKEHTPIYIVPESYLVPDNIIRKGKLSVFQSMPNKERKPALVPLELMYISTIKQNYAQRIANQAFVHPTRVGVNFIKKI